MDTIVLIISLVVGILGILIIWLGYQKDKTSIPKAKEILGKRILILITLKKVLLRSSSFDPGEPKKMDQKSLLRIDLN